MPVELSIACNDYGHVRALREGRVVVEGLRLDWTTSLEPSEIFYRQLRLGEFDLSEMSLANYSILVSRGDRRFVALPVFPYRAFRHGFIFVHRDAGIERPEDLRGRRVGVFEFHMTAVVFMRGFLQEDHGVRQQDVRWVQGGLNRPALPERLDFQPPPGVVIEQVPEGQTLNELLARGEIDAVLAVRPPLAFLQGDPAVRRLFPDYPAVEREFYRRTHIYPIMHCIAIQRPVYEQYPWLADGLYRAFSEAKDTYLQRLEEHSTLVLNLPWVDEHLAQLRSLLGRDLWPYGIEANRPTLAALERYLHDQGLSERRLKLEELFVLAG